jgi:hypothetical protein
MLKILFWLLLAINGALLALGQGVLDQHPQRTEPQRLERQLHPEQLILTPKAVATPAISAAAVGTAAAPSTTASPSTQPVTAPPVGTAPAVASAAASAASAALPAPAPAPAAAAAPAPTPAPVPVPTSAPVLASIPVVPASTPTPAAAPEKLLACVEIGNFDPNEARAFRSRLSAARLHVQPSQRSVQEVASYMVYIAAEDGREGAERRAAELRRLDLTDFYVMPDSSPMRDAISLGLFKTEAAANAYVGQLISKGVRSARVIERTASTNKVAFRLRGLNAADQAGFAVLVSAFPNQSRRDCSG